MFSGMNVGRGLWNMFVIYLAVLFWTPIAKFIMLKYPIPGLADLVAM